jgi:hypothetical protein
MRWKPWNAPIYAVIGLCYGIHLAFLAFLAAGAGHGTSVLIGLFSSPLGLMQRIGGPLTFLSIPVVWCVIGGLLGAMNRRVPRALFLAAMIAHYAALPIILGESSEFGDWGYVKRAAGAVLVGVAGYALGQIAIWALFAIGLWRSRQSARFGAKDLLLTAAFFVALFLIPGLVFLSYFYSLQDKDYAFEVEKPAHRWMVQLVKASNVKDLPNYDDGFGQDYYDRSCKFSPGPTFQCAHPLKLGGELCTWIQGTGKVRCESIPQPKGFKPQYDFDSYFGNPALWVNAMGDQLILWDLGGNGDHGLALRKRDADSFTRTRVRLYLANIRAICSPDGKWYLLVAESRAGASGLAVYALDDELRPTLIVRYQGANHENIKVADAAFVTKNRLRIVRREHLAELGFQRRSGWLRLRTMDLDIDKKQWIEGEEICRLDRFVSLASAAVHIMNDGSTHYLWHVDEGQTHTSASGLFYAAMDGGKTIKLADSYEAFKSVVVGDQIVVCYSLEYDTDKVYFRVIRNGFPGPATALKLSRTPSHSLWGDRLVLGERYESDFLVCKHT